ncbi:MAG TPA: hypothetical protein VN788_09490 [Verrucomicrobiae bacterium]|nr:hypothetical protein [Verrucomicrobiae bacterium]
MQTNIKASHREAPVCGGQARKVVRNGSSMQWQRQFKNIRIQGEGAMTAAKVIFLAILGVMIAACTTARAQTDQVPTAWGDAGDGLQIALYFDPSKRQDSGPDNVKLALRNVGVAEMNVVLGAGCGQFSPTNKIALVVTDREGKSLRFPDLAGNWFCAGLPGSFSVSLTPRAYYLMPFQISDYLKPDVMRAAVSAGVNSVQADLEIDRRGPGNATLVSHVKSNQLKMTIL